MAMCAATTLVFSAMSVMPASAADTFDIVATTDKTSYEAGDTVTVTVSCENNPGVNCWAVGVSYDKSVFEYVDSGVAKKYCKFCKAHTMHKETK